MIIHMKRKKYNPIPSEQNMEKMLLKIAVIIVKLKIKWNKIFNLSSHQNK